MKRACITRSIAAWTALVLYSGTAWTAEDADSADEDEAVVVWSNE